MSTVTTSPNRINTKMKPVVKPVIRIKSPKSEIKVHKLINEKIASPPEITIRGGSGPPTSDDNENKIYQAWNRLKINALSKAIAIAPDVVNCTIGPHSHSTDTPDFESIDNEKVDLQNVVTSTPLKSNERIKVKKIEDSVDCYKSETFNISQIIHDSNVSPTSYEVDQLTLLKNECLKNIETQIVKCGERKKQQQIKKWLENDAKIKEKLQAQKIEMDREMLIRIQNLYIESQKFVTEGKESSQKVKNQELQQSKSDHDKRIAETSERLKQIEQKRKELEEKQKKKREELKRCIEGIFQVQVAYGLKYNQISEVTKKCKNGQLLYTKISSDHQKLKEMGETLTKLVDKCGEGNVTPQDLKLAENLVQQITVIADTFSKHVGQINATMDKAEEEKKDEIEKVLRIKQVAAEREQRQKEENEKIEKEKMENEKPKEAESSGRQVRSVDDCFSAECLKWHLGLRKYLDDYEKKLQPLITNESLKKFRFDCQKVVNVPVNAISPLDDLHLEDKWYKLSRLLQGQAVPLGTTMFLATGHPLGVAYCTNLLAKKLVKQGEHTVSSKPEAAFAIAAVIVSLWAQFPELGRLLLAHFHRECPYLIPAFLPQTEGQSDQDYYKMLGYQYTEDGKVEPQNKFLRRMSGVMRLYAAILVTPLKRSLASRSMSHPYGMQEAWRWLAASLNLKPRPDISATLILDFLEVTGFLFFRIYGLQFTKLLHVLCADYFPLIEKITPDECGGPVVRLKNFLEKVLKEGDVSPPNGLLPPNFW
ncbi:mRNA export factor Gle1 isoform X2 [Macrosteles quadrilineatus]|uniref:mRNA export factor Gle1 isoform X2 n=1 Tax=Macrosteles quadrilineatus TaxID=74068 RepID=UPI0023E2DC25|nr:mRNA export factor Gle1 isoform X2 [Macrosteles quadrilineatus]